MEEELEDEPKVKGLSLVIIDPEFDPPVPVILSPQELREILIRME